MNGMIANLSIFNMALNDNIVMQIHEGDTASEDVPSIVGHWRMDEGVGPDVIDSVNGQNGSMTDGDWEYACIP